MPVLTANATSYNVVGNREQLLDAAYLVAQSDAPFVTQICAKETATAKLVEWQTDELPAAADNAVVEGAEASAATTVTTAKVGNRTQLMDYTARVSSSQQNIKAAGRSSEMARQVAIGMKKLVTDLERAALFTNVAVAGDAVSTPARMRGLESWLTTNIAHGAGGSTNSSTGVVTDGTPAAITKAGLDARLQAVFTAGGTPQTIMVGPANKRNLSAVISSVNSRQVAADRKQITDAVDVYLSDYGTLKIIANRTQRDRTLFILQDDLHAIAYLQPMSTKTLASTGHFDRELVFVEATYVCRNERGNGKIADLTV